MEVRGRLAVAAINGVKTRIEEEQVLLPELLPTAKVRAEKMLDLLLNFGSTHIRYTLQHRPSSYRTEELGSDHSGTGRL